MPFFYICLSQADKINTLTSAAKVECEAIWATLLAKVNCRSLFGVRTGEECGKDGAGIEIIGLHGGFTLDIREGWLIMIGRLDGPQ